MKSIWASIETRNWHAKTKYRVVLLLLGILYALVGFAMWMVVRIWALSTLDWMVCFTGYPVIISLFVVFFYSCNHDFHNGKFVRQDV